MLFIMIGSFKDLHWNSMYMCQVDYYRNRQLVEFWTFSILIGARRCREGGQSSPGTNKQVNRKTDHWKGWPLNNGVSELPEGSTWVWQIFQRSLWHVTLGTEQSALSLISRSSASGMAPKVLASWCMECIHWYRRLEKFFHCPEESVS